MKNIYEKEKYKDLIVKFYNLESDGDFCTLYYKKYKILTFKSVHVITEKNNNIDFIIQSLKEFDECANSFNSKQLINLTKVILYILYRYLLLRDIKVTKISYNWVLFNANNKNTKIVIDKINKTLEHNYWLKKIKKININNNDLYFVPKNDDSEKFYIIYGKSESGSSKLIEWQLKTAKIKEESIMHYRKMMADHSMVIETHFNSFLNDTIANLKNKKRGKKIVKYNSHSRKLFRLNFIKTIIIWLIPLMLSAYFTTSARQIFIEPYNIDLQAFANGLKETAIIFVPIIISLILIYFLWDIVYWFKNIKIKYKIRRISKLNKNQNKNDNQLPIFVIHDINEDNVEHILNFLNRKYLFNSNFNKTNIKIMLVISTDKFKNVNKKILNIIKKRTDENNTFKGYFKISNVCRNKEVIEGIYYEWLYREIIIKHNLNDGEFERLKKYIKPFLEVQKDFSNIRLFFKKLSFIYLKINDEKVINREKKIKNGINELIKELDTQTKVVISEDLHEGGE